MSISSSRTRKVLLDVEKLKSLEELARQVQPLAPDQIPTENAVFPGEAYAREGQERRLGELTQRTGKSYPYLSGAQSFHEHAALKGNIENYIGMAQMPIGLAGPMLVRGMNAQGIFYVPLATTEGALVASYSRGMKACLAAGGTTTACLTEGVKRSPYFRFTRFHEVGLFISWLLPQQEHFQGITEATSRYAKLLDIQTHTEGNSVILTFEFSTGDASGQNMVTLCTNAICQDILARSPVKPQHWYVESNFSGDKKATALSFSGVRGRKVISEVVLPAAVVEHVLHSTPRAMADYWQASTLAVVQSGAIGAQGHVANGLAALFIACGQDAACVAESATGITRMQLTDEGDLYVSVTLPNVMVGTVGGGTSLPTQRECLEMLDCYGPGKVRKLAEIAGAMSLAGEISIAAALTAGHFARAHAKLGRKA